MILHSKNKIASLLDKSFVVGSVALETSLAQLARLAVPTSADVVELRLDAYPECKPETLPALELPLLITVRCAAEGGRTELGPEQRSELLRKFLPKARVVDVEMQSLTAMTEICAEVRASPAILLASFHDFTGTPTLPQLRDQFRQATEAGAEAVKFATTLNHPSDLLTLMQLLAENPQVPMSVMGMGPLGKISRLLLAQLGSVFNYGYLDAATVPGQWPSARLKALLAEIAAP